MHLGPIKAIVVDLDGTLLNSGKRVSERNLDVLLRAHHAGIKIICATARPPRTVQLFLPVQLLGAGTFIYYNGAHVVNRLPDEEWRHPIGSDLTNDVVDFCLTTYPDCLLTMEVDDEWLSLKEFDASALVGVRSAPRIIDREEIRHLDGSTILKILLSGVIEGSSLQTRFGHLLSIIETDSGQLIQIMSKDASKEAAVKCICDKAKINLDEVIAFGDDYNDLGLLQVCGIGVAMGNAVEELKRAAHYVTETNDNDGVARMLEQLPLFKQPHI